MKNHADKRVVFVALFVNSAITLLKFIAAFVSGSAAMMAETFHSAADSVNQLMLLIGLARSKKPPDDEHPFGYGKEIYFWAFVVAVSIFFVGSALSIYEGINKIIQPVPVKSILLPLFVLGLSAIFEAYAWWVAFSEAKKIKKGKGISSFINMAIGTKNPVVMVVLFEDTAALIGLIVAAIGITLSYYFNIPVIDGISSLIIGTILFIVAFFLAWETKELLIGESASKEDRNKMRQAILKVPEVEKLGRLITMHLGPDEILVNLDVEFINDLTTDQVESAIDNIEAKIKEVVPEVKKIYIEAESITKRLVVQES